MGTATYVKSNHMFAGDARLYRLDPPHDGEGMVIVSAVNGTYFCETYIFPADDTGEVTDWGELDGSFRGGVDHARALRGLGYEIGEG